MNVHLDTAHTYLQVNVYHDGLVEIAINDDVLVDSQIGTDLSHNTIRDAIRNMLTEVGRHIFYELA